MMGSKFGDIQRLEAVENGVRERIPILDAVLQIPPYMAGVWGKLRKGASGTP
jgi:hypothetical protein